MAVRRFWSRRLERARKVPASRHADAETLSVRARGRLLPGSLIAESMYLLHLLLCLFGEQQITKMPRESW